MAEYGEWNRKGATLSDKTANKEVKMGRIVALVKIENLTDQDAKIRCDALVDTGVSYMVLPSAWRDRLGELDEITTVPLKTATQETVEGKICGPVRIQIEGFRPPLTSPFAGDKNED